MNLKQLEYFRTIAELEHFTKASEKLLVSQSSLSHSIKELENELGIDLFMRQGRNVKLTKYGEMLLPYVSQALEVLDEGCTRLENYVNPDTGTVSLSAQPSLSPFISYITVRYISETGRANVNFQINQENTYTGIREKVLSGQTDLAFSTAVENPRVENKLLGYHELVLLVSKNHRLAERESVDLHEVDGERFIPYDNTCQLRSVTDEVFHELNVHPKMSFETAQDNVIYGLVAANQGVSIVPRPLGAMPYNVKVLPIENAKLEPRPICLLWDKQNYLPPAAQRFREFVLKHGFIFDEYLLEM